VELRDYATVLIKRGWIILLVAAITAGSAFAFSQLQTVTYRSSIQLNVIPARLDWGLQQTIKSLMRNYSGEIKSRDTAQQIISRQQLDLSVDDLLKKMTVSPIESDFLMRIDVDDIDPQRAQLIAQTAAEIFVEDKQVQMLDQNKSDRVDVTIRDSATPATIFWPKTGLLMLAGGLFGLLAGALVVIGLERLAADLIRQSRDIERCTGLTVLGTIPAAAGRRTSPMVRQSDRRMVRDRQT
jgi:capsular polysaccharide biosynthesis protein